MARCVSLSHLTFYVSNAKQSALNWCVQYGFKPYRFKGLETGSRNHCAHAVSLNEIVLVFVSPFHDGAENQSLNSYITRHGNSVKDIALNVDSLSSLTEHIRSQGIPLSQWTECDDEGEVHYARVKSYGSTTHTLIERNSYPVESFLPKWRENPLDELLAKSLWSRLPPTGLKRIDHLAVNQLTNTMNQWAEWYQKTLNFDRFWSKDETVINTPNSGLRSVFLINDKSENIKMTINEPIQGVHKSQIQEFLDYHRGPGVQHIAFHTDDICTTIEQLKDRGVQFLDTPYTYYRNLEKRLAKDNVQINRKVEDLQQHHVLVDYDHTGHLFQIFTRPIEDRPTVFLELIERHHYGGFGAGNIKALFESIEEEQKQRGNI